VTSLFLAENLRLPNGKDPFRVNDLNVHVSFSNTALVYVPFNAKRIVPLYVGISKVSLDVKLVTFCAWAVGNRMGRDKAINKAVRVSVHVLLRVVKASRYHKLCYKLEL